MFIKQINNGTVAGNMIAEIKSKSEILATVLIDRVISQTLKTKDVTTMLSMSKQTNKTESAGLDAITGQFYGFMSNIMYAIAGVVLIILLVGGGALKSAGNFVSTIANHRKKLLAALIVVGLGLLGGGIYCLWTGGYMEGGVLLFVSILCAVGVYYVYKSKPGGEDTDEQDGDEEQSEDGDKE